ncbi:hypothetical protein [Paenibacillus sp. Soil750]|uniref:hypothetical protein n=1 Tax=Paenibacillus sp. Soil750 TaxID=1736398 RepID=UPI000AE0E656|nr:hypothetical protein [Paenibacillus sp. Soil750]
MNVGEAPLLGNKVNWKNSIYFSAYSLKIQFKWKMYSYFLKKRLYSYFPLKLAT